MTRVLGLLATLLLLPIPARAQEHAPTPQQCISDVTLWTRGFSTTEDDFYKSEAAYIDSGTPNHSKYAQLPFDTVLKRRAEMSACAIVDPDRDQKEIYKTYELFLDDVIESRQRNFIKRHHLMEQFDREDEQGIR
jgi:hypothetical protein